MSLEHTAAKRPPPPPPSQGIPLLHADIRRVAFPRVCIIYKAHA